MPPQGKQAGMVDGLTKIVQQIAALKLSPDADPEFLTQLETAILSYVHQQATAGSQTQQGQGAGAGAGFPPGASVPGMSAGAGDQAGGGIPPAGVPGVMQSPGMPNPDELRRMVGAAQQ